MPNYRRALVPGGCWFFTVNLLERRRTLLVDHIEMLRAAMSATRAKYPFEIDALVVLPDHPHAVLTLPECDADFPTRWRLIKTRFAKALPKQERLSDVRRARGERGIWQRRFWEHLIRDDADYALAERNPPSGAQGPCEFNRRAFSMQGCIRSHLLAQGLLHVACCCANITANRIPGLCADGERIAGW